METLIRYQILVFDGKSMELMALFTEGHPWVSDLGLHCLPISRKKDAVLIWVNPGLQIRVGTEKLFFLFLNQNICCGYSKELSQ